MAACTVEAMQSYRGTDDQQADDFEYECMKAKGYVFNATACPTTTGDPNGHEAESEAMCYRKPWPWE